MQLAFDVLKTRDVLNLSGIFCAKLNVNEAASCDMKIFRINRSFEKNSVKRSAPGVTTETVIEHLNYFIHNKKGIEERSFSYLVIIHF